MLDAGDVLTPDALFEMVYSLNRNPHWDFIDSEQDTSGRLWMARLTSPMRGWVAGARVFGSPGWSHAGASEDSSPGHPLIKHACATSDLIHSTQQTGLVPRILCRRARSGPDPINPPPEQPVVVTHAPFPLIELENVRSI